MYESTIIDENKKKKKSKTKNTKIVKQTNAVFV